MTTYLAYLHDAQTPDGWFHNFMGYDRSWQDHRGTARLVRPRGLGSRAIASRFAPRDAWRRVAARLFDAALPHVDGLAHLRSRAYAALGLAFVRSERRSTGRLRPPQRRCSQQSADRRGVRPEQSPIGAGAKRS